MNRVPAINGALFKKQRELVLTVHFREKDTILAWDGFLNWLDAMADYYHDVEGVDCLLTEDENEPRI